MINRRDFIKLSAIGTGLMSFGTFPVAALAGCKDGNKQSFSGCILPGHEVPVIANVDILVIGGTSGAVSAAQSAHLGGASVFVLAPMPYLGEDICGTKRFWLDDKEKADTDLARAIYKENNHPPSPLHVKTVLEDVLLKNNISFIYSSYLVDFIMDDKGVIGGGLLVNRSGCQAIIAKTIIDATLDGTGVRIANFPSSSRKIKLQKYEFTVVGNAPKQDKRIISIKKAGMDIMHKDKSYSAHTYLFELPDATNDYALLNSIEQQIRDITWDPDQVDCSDMLMFVPSRRVDSPQEKTGNQSIGDITVQACQPKGIPDFYMLNGFADISYENAWELLKPVSLIKAGGDIGKYAAAHVKDGSSANYKSADTGKGPDKQTGQTATEIAKPLRPSYNQGSISIPDKYIPVLGKYDVIIAGSGTSGSPAAISASRYGAKTLTLEFLHGLGGLSTMGKVNRYWDGFREGFTKEIDEGVCSIAPKDHPRRREVCVEWNSDWKMEWYRKEIRRQKGDIWFGSLCCGAVKINSKVCGVVVATPYGRCVVLSKIVIDSTSSADIAIAAGATYDFAGKQTEALQGGGLAWKNPDDFHNSTDWTFVNDTDILDVSRVFVAAKEKYKEMYDISQLPQTRERRRIVADYNVSVIDLFMERTYHDTVSHHQSSFDSHGYTIDKYLILKPPAERAKQYNANLPYRSFLPKGLDGILVTGLAVGVHRDVIPVVRMQACLQNQGYAIGYIAANAVKENKALRNTDIRKIQEHLISVGNLPANVTADSKTNYSDEELANASKSLVDNMEGLEILLTDMKRSLPVIKQDFIKKEGTAGVLNYAKVLGMHGDRDATSALMEEIKKYPEWDKGWVFFAMGQFGPCMSELDSLIIALGNTKEAEGLKVILPLASRLKPQSEFSHYRAVCMALECIASVQAAPVLYGLLNMPAMLNHTILSYQSARNIVNHNRVDHSSRNGSLKELYLAKALYACGDKNALGKTVLKRYTNDLRSNYALHAGGILANRE